MKVLFYIGILLIIAGVSLFLYLVFRKPENDLQSKILKELKGMRKDMHSEHQKIIQLIKQE